MFGPKTQPFSSRSSRSCSPKRTIAKTPVLDPIVVSALADLPFTDEVPCGICLSSGCHGRCLPVDFVPMHIVFGSPMVAEPKYRCRACTGLIAAPKAPLTYSDPVCLIPHQVRAGHTWLSIENPLTQYFRTVIREFWKRECEAYAQAQALEDPASSGSVGERDLMKPEDLPLVEAHALKNKLVAVLRSSGSSLGVGFSVHLEFVKPISKKNRH